MSETHYIIKAVHLYSKMTGVSLEESFIFIEKCLKKAVEKRTLVHIDRESGNVSVFLGDNKLESAAP